MQQAGDHWESPRASCERDLSSDEMFELTLELGLSKFWGMSESPGGCIKNAVSRASGLLMQGLPSGPGICTSQEPYVGF